MPIESEIVASEIAESEIAEPRSTERVLPFEDETDIDDDGPHVVILYNDDVHSMDEVVEQVIKATDYTVERCVEITMEAHTRGRAIAYTGSQEACLRSARILRQIRLQVETDKF